MSFSVHELPRAKSDKREIVNWLYERSPQGASAWLDAYDNTLQRLEQHAQSFGQAFENDSCPQFQLHQAFFKTRRGRVYRLIYFIEENNVYVLRVRGPGQAKVEPVDL